MPTLYLNNDGSRWIHVKDLWTRKRDMAFVLVLPDGTRKVRQADYYESFGNFAITVYRYKGKRHGGLAKAWDGSECTDQNATGINALPHIFHAA